MFGFKTGFHHHKYTRWIRSIIKGTPYEFKMCITCGKKKVRLI